MNKIVFLILAFVTLNAFHVKAAFEIINVTGVSYQETNLNQTAPASGGTTVLPIQNIYGGMAGVCSAPSSTETCDTCAGSNTFSSCNRRSVNPSLQIGFAVQFTQPISVQFPVNVQVSIGVNETNLTPISNPTPVQLNGVTNITIALPQITWGAICSNVSGFNQNCESSDTSFPSSLRLFLGIDEDGAGGITQAETKSVFIFFNRIEPNSTLREQNFCTLADADGRFGACGFSRVLPGDQKLLIEEVLTIGTAGALPAKPNADDPDWFGVALYYVQSPGSVFTYGQNVDAPPQIFTYDGSFQVVNPEVTGLQNNVNYCVGLGNVNKAQNILLLNTGSNQDSNLICGTPSEVVGLLDDKSCFISTAAYGSDHADEVQLFRDFRNQFLVHSNLGRKIIKTYYKLSPPLAHFISDHESLKLMTRGLLFPFFIFAWLSLKIHFAFAMMALVVVIVALNLFFKKRVRSET